MNWRLPGMVTLWGAIVLHLITGVMLILVPQELRTVSTAIPLAWFSQDGAGLMYLLVAALAWQGLKKPSFRGALLGAPQQAMLYLALASAFTSSVSGVYPDGTTVTPGHIFTDQMLTMLFPLIHGACLISYHGYGRWKAKLS